MRAGVADLAVLAFVVLVIAIPNSPGRVNADTVGMIGEARSGHITDWHSAMLEVVAQPFVRHLPIGLFFTLQTIVLIGASLAIARRHLRPFGARLVILVLWLNPLSYSYAAQFTRDVWVLMGLLATIACFEWMSAAHRRGRPGWAAGTLTVLSVLFTLAARQNAAAFLAPLAAAYAWKRYGAGGLKALWPRRSPPDESAGHLGDPTPSAAQVAGAGRPSGPGVGRRLVVTATATILVLVVPLLALSRIQPLVGVQKTGPQTGIMELDLDVYSFYTGKVELPPSATSPGLTIGDIRRLGSLYNPDLLFFGPQKARVYQALPPKARAQVQRAWLNLVEHHPITYAKIRTHLFLREIALTGPTRDTYVPAMIPNTVGLQTTRPHLAKLATEYMAKASTPQTELGRWLTRTWIWMLLALGAGLVMWRRGRPGLAFTLSAWLYVLVYIPTAPGLQFRLVAPSTIMCMGVVLALIATEGARWWDKNRARRVAAIAAGRLSA